MVNLKNMSSKSVINTIVRVVVILGCLLFVFSFVHPFYFVMWETPGGGFSTFYWSYKSDCDYYIGVGIGSSHPWFSDYWFTPTGSLQFGGLGIPWILISLFIVQILTLTFGVVFIISNRRILSFEPIVLSIAVLVLMNYAGERANEIFQLSTGIIGVKEYQLGYYIVYLSLAMFLFALLLNEVTKRKQATKSVEENRNNLSSVKTRTTMKNSIFKESRVT